MFKGIKLLKKQSLIDFVLFAAMQEVARQPGDDWMCITMVVAAEAKLDLPKSIYSLQDLEKALNKIGSVGADDLLAYELLWTPQAEDDAYTKEELIQDFPNLVPL